MSSSNNIRRLELSTAETWISALCVIFVVGLTVGIVGYYFYHSRRALYKAEELPHYAMVATPARTTGQSASVGAPRQPVTRLSSQQPANGAPKFKLEPKLQSIAVEPTPTPYVATSQAADFRSDLESLELFRVSPNDIAIRRCIASGAFGEVNEAFLHGRKIAAKKLLGGRKQLNDVKNFLSEIKLAARLDSPYIVKFVGVTWVTPNDITLLTEFLDGGDLRDALEKKNLSWSQKLQIASDVAEALSYLHSLEPKVIHRDLKSRNVLLDSKLRAKVTDFGIAREMDDATLTAGMGTFRWIAPEVLLDGHYSESADIFSFGVIMSELSTGILPYSDMVNAKGNKYTDTAIMTEVVHGKIKPSFSNKCEMWFNELGLACLEFNPEERPTAMEVAYKIRARMSS